MKSFFCGLALLVASAPSYAADFKPKTVVIPPVGTIVEATPGQEFYVETAVRSVPAYRLAYPFKSSMAGAMGLPFSFSIDDPLLILKGRSEDGVWAYFVPQNDAFHASHGLLGSVIRPGDMVGLRVDKHGVKEWFVDNSHYNRGLNTIWTRRVKEGDPPMELVESSTKTIGREPIERLVYLGVEQGRMKIRYEQFTAGRSSQKDEFTFPVDKEGRGLGAVNGAEFSVVAGPVKATIVVTKPMSGVDIIIPEKPEDAPPAKPTT
ncbi:hypothetical protein [Flavisphingomonas formosensis]|uniref:hypothetical protein n=1 Tax=Flavisphingomonas formosensis TaxID=861534 RepID=UPI0012F9BE31|nr:hypothetical protein [Sphingomonas formosensis]